MVLNPFPLAAEIKEFSRRHPDPIRCIDALLPLIDEASTTAVTVAEKRQPPGMIFGV